LLVRMMAGLGVGGLQPESGEGKTAIGRKELGQVMGEERGSSLQDHRWASCDKGRMSEDRGPRNEREKGDRQKSAEKNWCRKRQTDLVKWKLLCPRGKWVSGRREVPGRN